MPKFDLLVQGGQLVIPHTGVVKGDIGISGGKIAAIKESIPRDEAEKVVQAQGKHVFPGVVDTHSHVGIYRPLEEDARSESGCAASGGVTTILSYFRTGKNYLGKVGPFKEIWPELMDKSRDNFHIDYGYHVALMTPEQLNEAEWLVKECGVTTFKYYMFYKTLDLSGSADSSNYLINKTSLDFGFVYRMMKTINRINRDLPGGPVSLSVHCENPEMIPDTMEEVKAAPSGNKSLDYSNSRPAWLEELAIREVGTMARHTGCPVNLLHLTSKEAIEAGKREFADNPGLAILLESTLHHLSMHNEIDYGNEGKVNPPIRSQADVDYLWRSLIEGHIKTVVSDHACIMSDLKEGDLWTAMPGFGGTCLFFPVLLSEGFHKRGMSLTRIAEVSSFNPARHFHLYGRKGNIALGFDADLAIVDIEAEQEITLESLHSAGDFSPFVGTTLKGWNQTTISRGEVVYDQGRVVGRPGHGLYIKRPL